MDDRVAFRLGTRYSYNRALWQMLGSQTNWGFHKVTFPIFDLPMQSGEGFYLIHLWGEYIKYAKARHGGLHKYAEECRKIVRQYYE